MHEMKLVKEVEVPIQEPMETQPWWLPALHVVVCMSAISLIGGIGYALGVDDGRADLRQEQHDAYNWSYRTAFGVLRDNADPHYCGVAGTTCQNGEALRWDGACWRCDGLWHAGANFTSGTVLDYGTAALALDTAHSKFEVDGVELDVKRLAHDYAKPRPRRHRKGHR